MNAYVFLVAVSSVVSAGCAGYVLARGAKRAEAWLSVGLVGGGAYWAVCEAAAGLSGDPAVALRWLRAATPGWILLGPIVLHLLVRVHAEPTRLAGLVPAAWAVGAGFLALALFTDTIVQEPVRTAWGWAFQPGPLHLVFYFATLACLGAGLTLLKRAFDAGSEGEQRQRPIVLAGMFVPCTLASVTEVVLPWCGIHVPRLGAVSFAALGILAVWNIDRFGYTVMAPGSFADDILASLGQGVALLHRGGRIRAANACLERLSGRTRRELETLHIQDVIPDLAEPDPQAEERDSELVTAAGERVSVALTIRPMRDREGWVAGLVVSVRDLREIESLRSGLVASSRLAAVGQLAAGIAHEINNPLAYVRANLNQLRDHWQALRAALAAPSAALRERMEEGDDLIGESLQGVDRAADIVRGIKGFSQTDTSFRQDCDLHALLDEVVVMATPQLRGRTILERCYTELPPLYAAPQQLKQLFLNLVVNAAQAAGDGGHVRVATEREDGLVCIGVEDDGPGIAPEIRERIFDPFFTTRAVGEGTGLGLAIAHEIVQGHQGSIQVDTEPGRGTRFRVRLPLRGA